MARSPLAESPENRRASADPGAALLDLLGFVDAVSASLPSRPFEPLAFPAAGWLIPSGAFLRPRTHPTRAVNEHEEARRPQLEDCGCARDARLDAGPASVWRGGSALPGIAALRATTDIDLNVTLATRRRLSRSREHCCTWGVCVSPQHDRAADRARRPGSGLDWEGSYLDLFFATLALHREMAALSREVDFGPVPHPDPRLRST